MNNNYALSVYAASESNLTPVQCFLDRCFKRKYMSKPVSVYDFLERQCIKSINGWFTHPQICWQDFVK